MAEKIQVLIASPEVRPLAQTGGLADVAGSLPQALDRQGAGVAVIMPAYQSVLSKNIPLENMNLPFTIEQGGGLIQGDILKGELAPGIPAYLIKCDQFFDRPGLYGYQGQEFPDNPERFAFFCKAVLKALPHLADYPDVIVGNDWQTGLLMPLLMRSYLEKPKGVFVIHNQGYLGLVPPDKWPLLDLPDSYNSIDGLEYFGQSSLLKAGIVYSRAMVTVSPTYAKEVQTPEGGHGLDGAMRHHSRKFHGILNGIDYKVWDPETDRHLVANYSRDNMAGKLKCKAALKKELGLISPDDRPLVGMVGRLAAQKGLNLLDEAADDIFKLGLDLVILGSGEPFYEDMTLAMAQRFPDRCKVIIGYDEALSHRIIAASDLVTVPSMYEPCGLVQMYALKYGAVPVVRAVGGLNDTVRDYAGNSPDGQWDTGFKFSQFQEKALVLAMRRAIDLYARPKDFQAMVKAGMAEDFSWDSSARKYLALFKQVLEK
ncbi:glycogen synthase GlgA [Deltaproteobacteria bacterium OttesenSCG-928-K17]|nr:glycogen synthase GlgA [Deltaproteobacteria bacterium OttesenSCG-928-K17]